MYQKLFIIICVFFLLCFRFQKEEDLKFMSVLVLNQNEYFGEEKELGTVYFDSLMFDIQGFEYFLSDAKCQCYDTLFNSTRLIPFYYQESLNNLMTFYEDLNKVSMNQKNAINSYQGQVRMLVCTNKSNFIVVGKKKIKELIRIIENNQGYSTEFKDFIVKDISG